MANTFKTQRIFIYALVDPHTGRIMYIGQAVDVARRFRHHCEHLHFDSNNRKTQWVRSLHQAGLRPGLQTLQACDGPEAADKAERELIRKFKAKGEAELNLAPGGRVRTPPLAYSGHYDDWHELGRRLKSVRTHLNEVVQDFSGMIGVGRTKRLRLAMREIDRLKAELKAEVCRTFPEWREMFDWFDGEIESGMEPESVEHDSGVGTSVQSVIPRDEASGWPHVSFETKLWPGCFYCGSEDICAFSEYSPDHPRCIATYCFDCKHGYWWEPFPKKQEATPA